MRVRNGADVFFTGGLRTPICEKHNILKINGYRPHRMEAFITSHSFKPVLLSWGNHAVTFYYELFQSTFWEDSSELVQMKHTDLLPYTM